jgi:hypothetical protein
MPVTADRVDPGNGIFTDWGEAMTELSDLNSGDKARLRKFFKDEAALLALLPPEVPRPGDYHQPPKDLVLQWIGRIESSLFNKATAFFEEAEALGYDVESTKAKYHYLFELAIKRTAVLLQEIRHFQDHMPEEQIESFESTIEIYGERLFRELGLVVAK